MVDSNLDWGSVGVNFSHSSNCSNKLSETVSHTQDHACFTEPFVIEFCSGTAGLTAQFRALGMKKSFGIDHIVKGKAKAPICKLDLTNDETVGMVQKWIHHPLCLFGHFGVPCGTCSRAREIPLDDGGPVPLRSEAHPEGLPNLSQQDQTRVNLANRVYQVCCQLILLFHSLGKDWTLENPFRSLFWFTKFWREVLAITNPFFFCFHHCMFGGQRAKLTTVATSISALHELERICDNQHVHLPWGRTPYRFSTTQETEYPLDLCKQWAHYVVEFLRNKHAAAFHNAGSLLTAPDKQARALIARQTRSSPTFIPNFSHVDTAVVARDHCLVLRARLRASHPTLSGADIPKYATILRLHTLSSFPTARGEGGEKKAAKSDGAVEVAFGVPWDEKGFIQEVVNRGHPYNIFHGLSESMTLAVKNCTQLDEYKIMRDRAQWLKRWTNRAWELRAEEAALHETIPKHRQVIVRKKRFLVLKEILADEQYPDLEVVDHMIRGWDLTGECGGSKALPPDFQPASLTETDLLENAWSANKAIFHSTKGSGDGMVDAELWRKTCEELEKGWLLGPDPSLLEGGRVTRRFGIKQGEKVRPIDNYSESQVNDAATITNKCSVDGTDTICAMIVSCMNDLKAVGKDTGLVGRSFDLKAAYRQLAISDKSLKFARVAVFDPEARDTKCFQQLSMPFGARASVVAFLRCARMLQWLAHRLRIAVTCYFDDYVCVSSPQLARSTETTFETLLDLLGWEYDKEGDKADCMSQMVRALGVEFDLSETAEGRVFVRNTDKRKADLLEQLD